MYAYKKSAHKALWNFKNPTILLLSCKVLALSSKFWVGMKEALKVLSMFELFFKWGFARIIQGCLQVQWQSRIFYGWSLHTKIFFFLFYKNYRLNCILAWISCNHGTLHISLTRNEQLLFISLYMQSCPKGTSNCQQIEMCKKWVFFNRKNLLLPTPNKTRCAPCLLKLTPLPSAPKTRKHTQTHERRG